MHIYKSGVLLLCIHAYFYALWFNIQINQFTYNSTDFNAWCMDGPEAIICLICQVAIGLTYLKRDPKGGITSPGIITWKAALVVL